MPKCKELPGHSFRDAFLRNPEEHELYSIDLEGNRRVRVVLDEPQREVLRRMKQVRHFTGEAKRTAIEHPEQFFDGVLDSIVLPYGRRVEGIGEFQFVPTPHLTKTETIFGSDAGTDAEQENKRDPSHLEAVDSASQQPVRIDFPDQKSVCRFRERVGRALAEGAKSINYDGRQIAVDEDLFRALGESRPVQNGDGPEERHQERAKKYLLIYTDDEKLKEWDQQDVARAGEALLAAKPFETPASLRAEVGLKPHQLQGIQWLQNCHRLRSESRRGSLLADDMGLGKTLQILAYLAWCIETDPDLGLSSPAAP